MRSLDVHRSASCGTYHTHIWRGTRRLAWALGASGEAADRSAARMAREADPTLSEADLSAALARPVTPDTPRT